MDIEPVRAVAYLRISRDDSQRGLGIQRQLVDARLVAAAEGWGLDVITDNNTSAYTQRTVVLPDGRRVRRTVRPQFLRLLDGLRRGRWPALIVYHVDRLARQPRDLEDIIELVEQDGLVVRAVAGPSILPGDDATIQVARIMVAIGNQSSRDASRRVSRANRAMAEAGRPRGGSRVYGYEKDCMTLVPAEAAIVREIADRVLAGESHADITRDLNRRGVPPRTSRTQQWAPGVITKVVANPRYAGLRTYQGRVIGRANWPAIYTVDEHELLVEHTRLMQSRRAPELPTPRGLVGSRLLTHNVLRCGVCGYPMSCTRNHSLNLSYICSHPKRHVYRSMRKIDELIRDSVIDQMESLVRMRHRALSPTQAALLATTDGRNAAEAWEAWDITRRRDVVDALFNQILVFPQGHGSGASWRSDLVLAIPKTEA